VPGEGIRSVYMAADESSIAQKQMRCENGS